MSKVKRKTKRGDEGAEVEDARRGLCPGVVHFDELTYVSEEDWEKFHNMELTAEDIRNISYIGAEYSNFGHTAEYELEADIRGEHQKIRYTFSMVRFRSWGLDSSMHGRLTSVIHRLR